ncbi:hypothetical protein SG34_009345 [Thalassomonas viridans]|uniref:Uncharacterized protein n=1 Tax=Thalassomonas viridans TaxID=137584 RepID=A0AAE9Z5N8_9GAMM|nr:hypothetical protein [Thalassomonas viridans]WDE07068.1 hypothetical protein SG34_009345 [Thalassomonas viridans]
MMKKGLFALWLSSVGLSFFLGYKISPAHQPQTTPNQPEFAPARSENTSIAGVTAGKQQTTAPRVTTRPTSQAGTNEPVRVADSLAQIKALLGNGNMLMDMEGIAQSYLLVKNFSEQDVLDSLALLQNELEQTDNMMPLMLLLGRYAELNPQQAIAFAENNIHSSQSKMTAMSSVIGAWAKQDPQAAYDWFLASEQDSADSGFFNANSVGLMAIFNGLANRDLNDAIDKLADISDSNSDTMMAINGITTSFTDKAQFIRLMEKTEEFDDRRIQESILSTWTMKNPEDTVEWLDTIEDLEHKKALQQDVLRNWMFTEPLDAATWYMGSAGDSDKQAAGEQIISHWGRNNPQATLNWLEQQPEIDNEASTRNLLETSVFEHPQFAIDHLERLSSDSDKQRISFNIYLALEHESKQKAANFVASSPYKEALENEISEYRLRQAEQENARP